MAEELGNKELIEKLPKEGVHCYPASPSKITRNRLLSVVFFIIGAFMACYGIIKVNDDMIIKLGLIVAGCLMALISVLVFAQSFLIAKYRVAVDYNEKNVVLRYRYSKIAIPFENFDGRDGSPDQAEALIDKNFKKDANYYLVLDDVFEDACYQTSSSDLESVEDFRQLRDECFAIAEAYGARNSADKVKFYYEKDDKDTGSTDLDALIEETKAEKKAYEEAEAKARAEAEEARIAAEAAKEAEEKVEEAVEKAEETIEEKVEKVVEEATEAAKKEEAGK